MSNLSTKPRLSFFHDNRFQYDGEGSYYSATGFSNSLFEKYLRSFGHISITARKELLSPSDDKTKLDSIDLPGLTFECIDRLSVFDLFVGKDRHLIATQVANSDVVIARLPSMIGLVAAVEARRQKKLYLIELVACRWDSLWNYGKFLYKVLAPILYLIDRHVVYNAPYVLYVSSRFLQKRYPTRGRSVGCSDVDISSLDKDTAMTRYERIRSMHNTTELKIGTVASVEMKYKGQQYMIRAIATLIQQGYTIHYYLVGSGSNDYLTQLAQRYALEGYVHFVGPLPHHEIRSFMEGIDIYVQPSNAESHGRVILEAFETACPVIGSSTGGIPELVDNEFVFARKDVPSLLRVLRKMTRSKETLLQQAERNFNEVKKYSPELLDKRRWDFYEMIITELGASK